MKMLYWMLPLLVILFCVGCSGRKTDYEGKWVDVYGDTTLEITGNKLVVGYGEWKDAYRFKVRTEYDITYLSNQKGDGSFDLMTELKVCDDGSLEAYQMILDAKSLPYRFVREENKEKEMVIQDLSQDMPKKIRSKELKYFCLSFEHDGIYELDDSWPPGDYHWTVEKMKDGIYDMCFQVYQYSFVAINYHESVSEEYVLGLADCLEKCGAIEHNGYHMKNHKSNREYSLVALYESEESVSIEAQGEPAESCVFDLTALLDYAATQDLYHENE